MKALNRSDTSFQNPILPTVQPTTSAPPRVLNAEAELGMTPGLSNPPVTTAANDVPVKITTRTPAVEVH